MDNLNMTLRIYWMVVVLRQFRNCSTILWRVQVNFQWEDGEVRLHCVGFFYSASSLKQQSAGRHIASIGHIILIPSQHSPSLFCLNFWYASYERMKVQFCNLVPLMLKYTQANIYVWKTHSMLSSTITLFSITVSSFFSFCCTTRGRATQKSGRPQGNLVY
jgi:hypothetical protein